MSCICLSHKVRIQQKGWAIKVLCICSLKCPSNHCLSTYVCLLCVRHRPKTPNWICLLLRRTLWGRNREQSYFIEEKTESESWTEVPKLTWLINGRARIWFLAKSSSRVSALKHYSVNLNSTGESPPPPPASRDVSITPLHFLKRVIG